MLNVGLFICKPFPPVLGYFHSCNVLDNVPKFLLYTFFLSGIYLIIQVVDLFMIWGDLLLMTGTAFLLFTNLAQAAKIVNLLSNRDRIQKIVDEADLVLRDIHSTEEKKIVERSVPFGFCCCRLLLLLY